MELEVIAGSMSNLVIGYFVKSNEEQKLKFSTSFTNDSHCGAVRCIAVNNKGILASGSSDESIQLFKLKGKRKEIGNLRQHSATVVSLKFHDDTHLFSASEDGTIAIWKVGSWQCLKVLKHKSPVSDFAIHPSGKLLLASCKNRTLQTWNLLNGRRAFIVNLKDEGAQITFSGDGEYFVINSITYASVYLTDKAEVIDTITLQSKISSVVFFKPTILLLGLENGFVMFYNLKTQKMLFDLNTKTRRVKSMAIIDSKLVIASADGYIKMYEILVEPEDQLSITFMTGIVASKRWLCMCAFATSAEEAKKVSPKDDKKGDKDDVEDDAEEKDEDDEEEDDDDDDQEESDEEDGDDNEDEQEDMEE